VDLDVGGGGKGGRISVMVGRTEEGFSYLRHCVLWLVELEAAANEREQLFLQARGTTPHHSQRRDVATWKQHANIRTKNQTPANILKH
jgi:hypothetical protein